MEDIIIKVANCEENAWRVNNLLACRHCMNKGTYDEVMFQFITHDSAGVRQVRLIYQIGKK